MKISTFLPLLPLLYLSSLVYASPSPKPIQSRCYDLTLDIPVTATNYKLDTPRVDNNYEAVQLAIEQDRWNSPNATERIISEVHINDTYAIFAQLCFPRPRKDKGIIQILTHGGGFDHRYWDSELDPAQYSYVHAALDAGYTVFNYDRLGNGLSQKADAYTEVQAPLETEILQVLTQMIREGTLLSHTASGYSPKAGFTLPAFEKIIHVGHSLGSFTTIALLTKYGPQSSGAILTGFSFVHHSNFFSSLFNFQFAPENNPGQWADYPSGYIAIGNMTTLQNLFFHRFNSSDPQGFSDEALAYAWDIAQPVTVGETWSLKGLFDIGYSPDFTGPVQFFVGEYDFANCAGDCKGNSKEGLPEMLYPNATEVELYLQPGAGHVLPLHRNASAGFAVSLDFLARNEL